MSLPDGRTQIVTYQADPQHGYIAEVKYEGKTSYTPSPIGQYHGHKASATQLMTKTLPTRSLV